MDSVMTAFLWAIVGGVSYKFVSAIFAAGQHTLFARKIVFHCLTLMGTVVEDLAFMRELKYLYMSKSNMTEEQIEFIKKVDEQTLSNWKEGSIKIFKNSFPGSLGFIVKFNNWQEAMRELNKIHKGK